MERSSLEVVVAAVAVTLSTGLLLSWISRRVFLGRGRARRLPPGPKGWPLIGALPYLGQFPHISLHGLSKKYGSVMYVHLGSLNVLVISSGAMAKEVLQRNDQVFASRPHLLVPFCFSYGRKDIAWSPYGLYWRQIRKITNLQLLTSSKLFHFMGVLKEEILSTVHTVLEQAKSGGEDSFDVGAVINGMTMNIITQMMWNKRHRNTTGSIRSQNDEKFEHVIKRIMALGGANNVADFLPSSLQSIAMKLSGLERMAKDTRAELDEFCESIICEKEQDLVSAKESKAAADEDDFVNVMLKLKNEILSDDSHGLSRDSMKAILVDMITAGTDTTSLTLDWTLSELLRHPEMMKKAQDELTAVVGEDRLVNELDIPNLKYIDAVIKEVLRKYSAAPLSVPHQSTADCKVGEYDVPANTTVFINIYAIHNDPTVWEKPEEFNPDRFLNSDLDYKGRNFEYIPFSSGRRMCPGMNLASTVLHLGLAQLLHCVKWSLPEGQTPDDLDMTASSGLTLMKANPLRVVARPRLPHHVLYPGMASAA